MTFRNFLRWFFPPPRRPVTAGAAAPLALFLIAFIATCVALDWLDIVLFTSPAWFALLVIAPWFWWMQVGGYSGLSGGRGAAAVFIRLLLLGLFIVLLAEPRAVRKHDTLSVIFALDTSASIGQGTSDEAMTFITRIASQKPEKDEVGLVAFARDAAVELPPAVSFPFEQAITMQLDRDGTNLAKSLSLAAAMLPPEHQGRVVLISDGASTEGDLTSVLDELKSRQIAVDVLPVQYDFDHEVWVERLELPRFTKIGETYEAVIILSSLQAGDGKLVLEENGRVIFDQPVKFDPGKNRYVIPIYLREPGYYEYEATIQVPREKDGWRRNNRAISYLFLKGEGKVLVVTNPGGDPRDYQMMVKTMREAERTVEVVDAFQFPTDPLALLPYDCIVFANVPADAFAAPHFIALRDTVKNQGAGFIMIGGENSYGPGGYHRTEVEEILPVTMDITQRKIMPKSALAITLHTCEFPEGNTWAKRITKQAIKVLGARDEVGVLVYDWQGGDSWLFEMTPAGEYDALVPKINAAQIGDMPSFVPTMKLALNALKANNAATKHMIIISDGDPQPPTPALLQQFVAAGISITTVAVFPHGTQVTAMRMIAQTTGGRFYFPNDPALLPKIFIKEAKTLRRSMIQNETFTPQFQFSSPILKGIDAAPQLHGYVLTTPKKRSRTILEGPDEEEEDPVLATWRYGVGKTAAYTSDLSPNWAKDWLQWDKYRAFVKQLLTDVSRVSKPSAIRMQSYAVGNSGVVVVEDYARDAAFLNLQTMVTGPRDETRNIQLKQVGPRRYEGRFDLWGEGRYQIMSIGEGGGRNERVHSGFAVPYSHEYLRFRANPIALEEIRKKTGGRRLQGDEKGDDIFGVERLERQSSKPVFDWFLLLLAVLVPLDVAVRRVHIDAKTLKGWFGMGRDAPSKQTFTTLLKRKQAVESTLKRSEDAPPVPTRGPDFVIEKTVAPQPGQPPAAPQDHSEEPADSTTGRLLALKRKRDTESEEEQ